MTETSTPSLAQVAATVQTILGGMFVTTTLSIMLYGITTTQAYIYLFKFPGDFKIIRWTVLVVWVLETVHTAFCIDLLYHFFITNFGNLLGVSEVVWTGAGTIVCEVSISLIVQGFFVRRIWILSRSRLFTAIPATLAIIHAGVGYASGSLSLSYATWSDFEISLGPKISITLTLALAAATDFCIAAMMLFHLQRGRTGINQTDHLIRRLQAYVINTGILTMIGSIAILLTFALLKGSLLFIGLIQLQGKLYANSLLGTLNARTGTAETQGSSNSMELKRRQGTSSNSFRMGVSQIEVFQHVSSDHVGDGVVTIVPPLHQETAGSSDGRSAKEMMLA